MVKILSVSFVLHSHVQWNLRRENNPSVHYSEVICFKRLTIIMLGTASYCSINILESWVGSYIVKVCFADLI